MNIINEECILEKGNHEGFDYYICNAGTGYRNGYVVVPEGTVIPEDISVYGGITWRSLTENKDMLLGFDCGHAFDLIDPTLPHDDAFGTYNQRLEFENMIQKSFGSKMSIKDNDFVRKECYSICEQIKEVNK